MPCSTGIGTHNCVLVVFGDESRFVLYPVDGNQCIRQRTGECLPDQCVHNRVAGGGGSVHVWVAFCETAKNELFILDQNMIGAMSRPILYQNLVSCARGIFGDNFTCQDDHAHAHRARVL